MNAVAHVDQPVIIMIIVIYINPIEQLSRFGVQREALVSGPTRLGSTREMTKLSHRLSRTAKTWLHENTNSEAANKPVLAPLNSRQSSLLSFR